MENQVTKSKKQHGDAVRICEIANVIRLEKGLKSYSQRTIRAMLKGERTMNEDVQEASNRYYDAINNLKNITV